MTVRLPRRDRSSVLLIGTSIYESPDLPDLPAVHNNLRELKSALTDPRYGGINAANCRIIHQPASPMDISRALSEAARDADDTLIVYFSGHGIAGRTSDELFLALPDSHPEYPGFSALRYDDLRSLLVSSGDVHARNRVVILDCCFSGRAIPTMSATQVGGLVDIEGVYVLTATARNQKALAPDGAEYTAFTGVLLDVLRNGIADGPELLSLGVIHERLRTVLRARDLPRPEQVNYQTAASLALARNPAYLPTPIAPVKPALPKPATTQEPTPRTAKTLATAHPLPPPTSLKPAPRTTAPQTTTPPTAPAQTVLPPTVAPAPVAPAPVAPAPAIPRMPSPAPTRKPAARAATVRSRRRHSRTTLFGALGRCTAAVWMGVAHTAGWAVRAVGPRPAASPDHDPERRRDGGALALICVAALLAAPLWFGGPGPIGGWIAGRLRLALGVVAAVLPVILFIGALRRLRTAPDPDARGRDVVGWCALFIGGGGLLHIAVGSPRRSPGLEQAGGLLGRFGGGLLDAALTSWVAVPLLVLLSLFGLLVITATPISKIPDRLLRLTDVLLGRSPTQTPLPDPGLPDLDPLGSSEAGTARPVRRSPGRRRQGSLGNISVGAEAGEAVNLTDGEPIVHDTVLMPGAGTGQEEADR